MSLEHFMQGAVSPWMSADGPDADIVLSSRVRLARNLQQYPFPIMASGESNREVKDLMAQNIDGQSYDTLGTFSMQEMAQLQPIESRVLVEKHMISPNLAQGSNHGAVLINEGQSVSIMVNEEDHLRLQCLFPAFQLNEALTLASGVDDWLEQKMDYAYDERRGYLTSCPTNVGTGMRASVMVHLPALVLTNQMNRMIPAVNQLGLVVRGIYGEGSEALGNLFQISNQITLGKSEEDIVEDLRGVAMQLIQQERHARESLIASAKTRLEDRAFRSYGILDNSRVIDSKEAATRLSDVGLGIDVGLIEGLSRNILNELMILTQPGFLQQYAEASLGADERDRLRATLIRERLNMERKGEKPQ